MTLAIRQFNDKTIRFREDGYVCLTDMAKATGKKTNDWLRLASSKSYLEVLSGITGITVNQLIETKVGNLGDMSGTWGHPKVAIRFAQWCSDEFAVQVDFWVDELMTTGKVELAQPVPQLPPSDIRLDNLKRNLEAFGVDLSNPRFKQPLADLALNILGVPQLLPGSSSSSEYLGVAEIAEGLGYLPILVAKHRSQLGKYVKQFSGVTPNQERRLVNGTYRVVNVYPSNSQSVVDTISEFFQLHNQ